MDAELAPTWPPPGSIFHPSSSASPAAWSVPGQGEDWGKHTCSAPGHSQPATAWMTLLKPQGLLLHPAPSDSNCTSALSCAAPEAAHTLILTSLCLRASAPARPGRKGGAGRGEKAPDNIRQPPLSPQNGQRPSRGAPLQLRRSPGSAARCPPRTCAVPVCCVCTRQWEVGNLLTPPA